MSMKRSARFLLLSILLHALVIVAGAFLLRAFYRPSHKSMLDITLIQYESVREAPVQDILQDDMLEPKPTKTAGSQAKATAVRTAPPEAAPIKPEPEAQSDEAAPLPPPETGEAYIALAGAGMFSLSHKVLVSAADSVETEKPVISGPDKALAGYFSSIKANTKISAVPYDARLFKFRNDLEDFWNPEFSEIHEETVKKAMVKWAKNYKKAVRHYGKTGQPYSGSSSSNYGSNEKTGDPNEQGLKLLDTYNEIAESDAWTTSVRVVVDLDLDGKGGWRVSIAKPSGHASYDHEAVEDLEKALGSKSLSLSKDPIKLRLALEADFSITPPLPMAGFSFDLALKHFDLSYPLKKKIRKHIRLLDISYPETEIG